MQRFCLLLLAACSCLAQTPAPKSAQDAYQYIQARRDEGRALYQKGDPASLDKAVQILNDALAYLNNGLVHELAVGSQPLESRRVNIYYDLAEAYALAGKDSQSIEYLRRFLELAPEPTVAKFLESSTPLNRLHDNPQFKEILSRFHEFSEYWDSAALTTPYRENISDAEKLAGLSKLWSDVKYNFGFPEKLLDVHWDRLYLESIPKVLATASTAAYYRELQALCARLKDGHTSVIPPRELQVGKPPMYTRLIDGRVMILRVGSPSLETQGIKRGMEITEVDGEPAVAYAKRQYEPYQSASTPQGLDIRTFTYAFLTGAPSQSIRLKLRDASGSEIEKTIARTGYSHDVTPPPGFEWHVLPGNMAYVAINRFDQQSIDKQFAGAFPKFCESSALILDLRMNGGGDSGIGFAILRYLLSAPVLAQRQVERIHHPTDRARGNETIGTLERPGFSIPPADGQRYRNPVVVLTSPATFSAAEDFLVAWQTSGRGKIIGEPSGGSTGQPLHITLPGGGSASICSKKDTFADGRIWEGIGIQPDIPVQPSAADVMAGRDTVLDRAIEYLKTLM